MFKISFFPIKNESLSKQDFLRVILLTAFFFVFLLPLNAAEFEEAQSQFNAGKYDDEFAAIKALPEAELRQKYNTRDIEPD